MAQFHQTALLASFVLTLHILTSGVVSKDFVVVNKCDYTVWPGILSNAGVSPLSNTGFVLQSGESKTISAPSSWGGRFWGRTHCSEDSAGIFSCATGDCGSGKIECLGSGAKPPATLAEITLDGHGGLDFYDVSLVDGYNLPMLFSPPAGAAGPNCSATGCHVDLNEACPSELKVTSASASGVGIACRSACEAFKDDQYCCAGAYNTPGTCKPSSYAAMFKSACPRAYSYAYDDTSSTFTCSSAESYTITFCPSPNTSLKSSQDGQNTQTTNSNKNSPYINGTMVYEGVLEGINGSSPSTCPHVMMTLIITVALAFWPFLQMCF